MEVWIRMKSFRELPVEDRLSAERRYEIMRKEIEALQEAIRGGETAEPAEDAPKKTSKKGK